MALFRSYVAVQSAGGGAVVHRSIQRVVSKSSVRMAGVRDAIAGSRRRGGSVHEGAHIQVS